ncbi:hypothetical protein [Nocardia sp. XZ_19_369]|uniref:hypothetical protein n=1 Tax=Nocardia sp. XZ_19_369 TaxID=2769487 RepID=UPI00189000E7|nr:hypothetical protein [Nocardia sp. XZ_19_369]
MRYTPNQGRQVLGPSSRQLDPAERPPLELVPAELAALLTERDTIAERVSVADTARAHLADEQRDRDAERADADTAAAAARAGKPIPAPKAIPKLTSDRDKATRELDAHRAALAAVTIECEDAKTRAWFASEDPRPDLLAALLPKAEALAAELEVAVSAFAARDWLGGYGYDTTARVWPVAIDTDLRRQGLTVDNTNPFPARDLILGAVVQALTTEV